MAKTGFHLSIKKLLLLGFLFVVLLVIPLTVYLVQQQQENRSQATPNTTMAFDPDNVTALVGDDISFDVILTPGNNQVNFVKLVIKYDATKFKATNNSFAVDPNSKLTILQGPVVGNGTISVALSVGSDPTKVIQTVTKIGTVTFEVIDGPAENSQITFDSATEVSSINGANQDAFNENVFLNGTPASVTITDGDSIDPSPTVDPNLSPSPTAAVNSGGSNSSPVCSSLEADKLTGTAPLTVNFTARGTDSDGIVENFEFTFADNETLDVASDSANAVAKASFTYDTANTYTASVELTDDKDATGTSVACTKTITVTAASASTTSNSNSSGSTNTSTNTNTTTSTTTNNSAATGSTDLSDSSSTSGSEETTSSELSTSEEAPSPMPATGPEETIVGIGVLGGILLLIGTLLFFAL